MNNEKRVLFILLSNILGEESFFDNYNFGNTIYCAAAASYFYSPEISCDFIILEDVIKNIEEDKDWAYRNYDLAIFATANIFSIGMQEWLRERANLIRKLKIPFYIFGCGAQSSIDYDTKFVTTIYDSNAIKFASW